MTAYGPHRDLARAKALGVSAALLLLAACASPMGGAPAASAPMTAVTAPATTPPAAPASRAARPMVASMTPPPAAMPARPALPPTDAVSLRSAYGAPDFVRREMDSELWRYDGAGCAAFFFLYRDGDIWRLRYSETMPRGRDMPADAACIAGLSARAARMS